MEGTKTSDSCRAITDLLSAKVPLDDDSFELVYAHYKPALVRFASKANAGDPEGIADLALFDAYRAFDRMNSREERSFRAYLFSAARSHISAGRRGIGAIPCEILDESAAIESPENRIVEHDWLRRLVDDLPPDQLATIESRFFEELPSSAIATKLGKSPNAIYQLQHQALRRLRNAIIAAAVLMAMAVALWAYAQVSGSNSHTLLDNSPITRPDRSPQLEPDQSNRVIAEGDGQGLPQNVGTLFDQTQPIQFRTAEFFTDSSDTKRDEADSTSAAPQVAAREGTTAHNQPAPKSTAPPPRGMVATAPRPPGTSAATQQSATPTTQQPSPMTTAIMTTSIKATTADPPSQTTATSLATTALPHTETCNGVPATIVGGKGTIYGTEGADVIVGTNGKDIIYGLGGDDIICGGNGKDTIYGGPGDDTLIGGSSKDTLDGGAGSNTLIQDG